MPSGRGDVAHDVGDGADAVQVDRAGLARPRRRAACRMPTWRCSRTACCAAAIERGRPTVTGSTMPGKQHDVAHRHDDRWRRPAAAACGRGCRAALCASARPVISVSATATPPLCCRRDQQAAVRRTCGGRRCSGRRAARTRRSKRPCGSSRRWMTAVRSSAGSTRVPATTRSPPSIDRLDLLGLDARQRDEDQHLALGLQHIDRRLPGRQPRARARRLEELPVQALGPRQHLARLRPHPIAGHVARDWMWSEACEMLARAERMHREIFRPAATQARQVAWEPPVDILETDLEVLVLVALPGVDADSAQAVIEDGDPRHRRHARLSARTAHRDHPPARAAARPLLAPAAAAGRAATAA